MAEVITERWRDGGCYSIDFTVGQSFGEPQVKKVFEKLKVGT
jgi:hypothetical protein